MELERKVEELEAIIRIQKETIRMYKETIELKNETHRLEKSNVSRIVDIYKKLYEFKIEERDKLLHAFESIISPLCDADNEEVAGLKLFRKYIQGMLYGNTEEIGNKDKNENW